jgi:hypothetical protein
MVLSAAGPPPRRAIFEAAEIPPNKHFDRSSGTANVLKVTQWIEKYVVLIVQNALDAILLPANLEQEDLRFGAKCLTGLSKLGHHFRVSQRVEIVPPQRRRQFHPSAMRPVGGAMTGAR